MPHSKNKKPQLHQSHLQTLYRCGYKFERVVLYGEREPSTTPLVVGQSTHLSVAKNLQNKIDRGSLFPRDMVKDLSGDDFVKTWDESQIVLNPDERFAGLQKTKDALKDQTIELVIEHHYDIAPKINPIAVERKWVIESKDKDGNDTFDFDMSGCIDVDEGVGIRDTKTRKTNLGQGEVDKSEQYTFYAFAKYVLDGKMPEYVCQDNLIKPTKTRGARAMTYYSTRTKDDFIVLHKRFDQANKIIKAGMFTPANPSDWWCSKDFCGFAANGTCPYFNSKSRKPYIKPEEKGETHHEREESILESLTATLSHEND